MYNYRSEKEKLIIHDRFAATETIILIKYTRYLKKHFRHLDKNKNSILSDVLSNIVFFNYYCIINLSLDRNDKFQSIQFSLHE